MVWYHPPSLWLGGEERTRSEGEPRGTGIDSSEDGRQIQVHPRGTQRFIAGPAEDLQARRRARIYADFAEVRDKRRGSAFFRDREAFPVDEGREVPRASSCTSLRIARASRVGRVAR